MDQHGLQCRWQRQRRYYEARLERDLFGWCITRVWGRRGTPRGQVRSAPVEDYRQGAALMEEIARTRAKRGYRRIG